MLVTGTSWSDMGVEIPPNKENADTDVSIKVCPRCKDEGHRTDNSFSLSVIPAKGVGKCHKCDTSFKIIEEKLAENVQYTPPPRKNFTNLSDRGLKVFTDRKITMEAVIAHKIVESKRGEIVFPYFENGELVNAKYRAVEEKKFYQSKDAKQVMYNMDNVIESWKGQSRKQLIIVEGEFDSLAWETAGIPFSTSVSQGAPNANDASVDRKLECITNSYDFLNEADIIYIGVDKDQNGDRLKRELIRRFPFEKIQIIDYGDWKDANEYLMWEGHDKLADLLESAEPPKIEGVFTAADVSSQLMDFLERGLPVGTTTYFPSIDRHWKWRPDVNLVTGYNNEGKTLMILQMAIVKAKKEGWKFAIFSPENLPQEELWEDMAHTYIGKSMDEAAGKNRMTEAELIEAIDFLKRHFFLVSPKEGSKVEVLFEKFSHLVHTEGIRGIIIDPYNQIEHRMENGETEHLYASRFMSLLKSFQIRYMVTIILIMHMITPRGVKKGEDYPEPDKYGIKGGGTFSDKTDNALIVWRPYARTDPKNPSVMFKADKIKKVKLTGQRGEAYLSYDWKTNRYLDPLLGGKSPLDNPLTKVDEFQQDMYEDIQVLNKYDAGTTDGDLPW